MLCTPGPSLMSVRASPSPGDDGAADADAAADDDEEEDDGNEDHCFQRIIATIGPIIRVKSARGK